MKFTRIILAVLAGAALLSGCNKEDLSSKEPSIELSQKKFESLTKDQQSVTFTVAATRDWEIKNTVDWIAFEPSKGAASSKPQTVTATILENTAMNRKVTITVKAGLAEESILFSQDGPQGGITEGDGTKAKPYSASQAHDLAAKLAAGATSSEKVYIKGIISKLHKDHTAEKIEQYGNGTFFITDDGNENKDSDFLCFQVYYLGGAKFSSADQVKVGDVVTIYGKYTHFKGESGYSTYETEGKGSAYIYELNGQTAESTATDMTIDQAIAAKTGYANVTGRVIATSNNGFIINDGTQNNMFVPKPETTVKVGDIVKVTGALNKYGSTIRLGDANNHEDIKVETSTATIPDTAVQTTVTLEQKDFASYDSKGSAAMVSVVGGTLKTTETDGIKYYNLDFGQGVKPAGSVYTGRDLSGYLDKKLKVTGYYCGHTGNWFMVMETDIEGDNTKSFNVTPTTLSVSAAGGKVTFNVTGDVAWTATASDTALTLDNASGTGAATVGVTVPENTVSEKRSFTVTVSTTEDVVTKSYTVTISQLGAAGEGVTAYELTNAEICTAVQKGDGYSQADITSAGGNWTGNFMHAANQTFLQIRDNNALYMTSPKYDGTVTKIVAFVTASKKASTSQPRALYAMPVVDPAKLPTGKDANNKNIQYSADTVTGNYGYAEYNNQTPPESIEINMAEAGVSQFSLLSFKGASYYDKFIVYVKK